MSASPTNEEIMQAMKDSGYLLEQDVATQFERMGFHVRTNVAFEDQEEGKSREIDVKAVKRVALNEAAKLSAFVELIVECKNSSNPFVFVTRPKNEVDNQAQPEEFLYPAEYKMEKQTGANVITRREVSPFFHLGFADVHYGHLSPAKTVQFCRIDRKGNSWHANHGGLYDALFYPMAKAVSARLADIPRSRTTDSWRYIWLFFPLIVTTSDLFSIDSTQAEPSPSEENWVRFLRELKSGKLAGTYGLDFVRQQRLEQFVQTCVDPLAELARDLVMNRSEFLLQAKLPWEG